MGNFSIRIPSSGSLQELLDTMPLSVKRFLKEGFSLLEKVPQSKFGDLSVVVLDSIESGSGTEQSGVGNKFGLSDSEAGTALGSLSILAGLLATGDVAANALIEELVRGNALDSSHSQSVLNFANAFASKKAAVRLAIETSELASEVLPSFRALNTTVDLRPRFEKGRITVAVPVALLYIDTDVRNHELWVQVTEKQLQKLVSDLQAVLKRMEQAQNWATKGNKES